MSLESVTDMHDTDLVQCIMRFDNYMLGLVHSGTLRVDIELPFLGRRYYFSRFLQLFLHHSLRSTFFTAVTEKDVCSLREDVLQLPAQHFAAKLNKQFFTIGTLTFFLSPFLFVAYACLHVYEKMEELRTSPTKVSLRKWCPYAEWRLRLFNEVPHCARKRLNLALPYAIRYMRAFSIELVNIVAR
jgi:autophagy-related protein 9